MNSRPEDTPGILFNQRGKRFLVFATGLMACFASPLTSLLRFSLQSELYSHVLLVPAITGYLIWMDRQKISRTFAPAGRLAGVFLLAGVGLLAGYWWGISSGWRPANENDRLSLLTLDFLLLLTGGFAWIFGGRVLRSVAFPIAFLIFMVPMPMVLENGMVNFLQLASAETSYRLLTWSGMSVFRQGTQFTLPGVVIGVAPECSGVRSTLVLFMTGLLAAYFFLRQKWSQLTLVGMLVPLGILRNAVRIFTLAQLAVHVNPDILDSSLHHRGGPIFFAVSLAPFFFLVWLLRKCEARQHSKTVLLK